MALKDTPVSALLVACYVVDWIVIIAVFAVGAVVSSIKPNERPFSLVNTKISYPYVTRETISLGVLVIVSLLALAIINPPCVSCSCTANHC
ncbi:hypothetical protein B0J12DRAFT_680932 [Macrophomina phaseolina]|uniref:Uncharacterized protein n=1 Tax=Macrophomina phaseolina TaxID=35725 RepID=A0ABQ8FWM7_9PEZI|nr:hypothetical protein B0J12DRAFT_680932 [Macrophomina phaseolina]